MSVSTITINDICARVRARWGSLVPLTLIPRADHNIALCVYGGCERLGRAVKDSQDRHLLVKEINATPIAGVIDLSTATYKNIFIDTYRLPGALRTQTESAAVFKHAPSIDALRAATPSDSTCVWFHLLGKKLIFKNPATGALNTYATALSLAGSHVPDVGDSVNFPLDITLEDQLVDRVAEIVKQLGGLDFLKADDETAGRAAAVIGSGQ